MTGRTRQIDSELCPECCEHGVGLTWFCGWCAEVEEFGTSDYGVWGSELIVPCEHRSERPQAKPA